VPSSTTYNPTTGVLYQKFAFNKLQATYDFNGYGTLNWVKDGRNNVTTYSNYMRGLAQNIAYADGTGASAVVNGLGQVRSVTNEVNQTTSYSYDAMGRLASITYPNEPLGPYNVTMLAFAPTSSLESGLPAGHWRQTITTGTGTVTNLVDALWRKRVSYSSISGTAVSAQLAQYDADGRVIFQSYPLGTVPLITDTPFGTGTVYDALGRVTLRTQDTELIPAQRTSSTSYLSGFLTQTSDFNGNVSTSSFQAFDTPSEDALASLTGPVDLHLIINRDVFGKPLSIRKYGSSGGVATDVTRSYVYDYYHLLCKTIEPELGATLQDWDAAGNLSWRTGGTALTSNTCDRGNVNGAQQISFGYDARNRLSSTSYGDGSPGVTRTYWADGLPYQTISNGSTWTYGYSNRRLPTSETLSYGGTSYVIGRGYNANGHLNDLTYPDPGPTLVAYAPDALGRATQVGGFATGITYWPNGAVHTYSHGNGVAHVMSQNTRGLPLVMTDSGKVSDQYGYDANGNVTAITDLQEGVTSRSMTYDGLNRLWTANGSIWGTGTYTYDVQDNTRRSIVGARSATHGYDGNNRLSSVSGSGVNLSYGYDANGNINNRSGQVYAFDLGNRMTSAPGKSSYAYDGEGRRVFISNSDGTSQVQVYDHAGQLLYATSAGGTPSSTKFIYLGAKLIWSTYAVFDVRLYPNVLHCVTVAGRPLASKLDAAYVKFTPCCEITRCWSRVTEDSSPLLNAWPLLA
jgi:YD repeat-containing protein